MAASIESGSSISHYRVLGPLGSGGMGEVYVARDTSLDRTIALKILPPELTRSEERVRRFVQEAKSASSLSHPHIVTIHEIGNAAVESESSPKSDPVHFIAMELIEGRTLAAKIHRDGIELRTLLTYLQQAAEGLSKAHAAGIVHRDLKPDNIMVTSDGYAKVLDFGLAKLQVRKDADASIDGPTQVRGNTREGTLLGTVGYMAPEQVQGKQVDHRADIFSFGCILYEAVTKQRPFRADSDVDVMHQILHDKPQPVEELNPEVPAELRRIIRRCLAKEPEKRVQSMKDLALELGEIVDEFDTLPRSDDSKRPASSSGSASRPPIAVASAARPWLIPAVAGAVVIALVAAILLVRRTTHEVAKPAPSTFLAMKMNRLTSSGDVTGAALSHDNRYLAHIVLENGKPSLRVRQIATGADATLVAPSALPFRGVTFSPDGDYIYFTQAESETSGYSIVYQIPSLGGSPRKILFDVDSSISFAPDGKRFTFVRGMPQFNASALMQGTIDGAEKKIAVRKGEASFPLPLPAAWSNDGKKIAVIGAHGGDPELLAVDVATGAEQKVGTTKWFQLSGAAWLPDDSGIVLAAIDRSVSRLGQLWLVDYPSGQVRRITNDLNNYLGVSVTSDGKTIATIQSNSSSTILSVTPSAGNAEKAWTHGTQESAVSALAATPDGAVLQVSVADGKTSVNEIAATGERRKLQISDDVIFGTVSLSRDGRVLLGTRLRDGAPHIVKMERDGSNIVELTHGSFENAVRVSPDGTWFIYRTGDGTIMRMSVAGGAAKMIAPHTEGRPSISPDGTRIAYDIQQQVGERASAFLLVGSADGGAPTARFAADGMSYYTFAPAGDAIDYIIRKDGIDNVWRQPLAGGAPKQLTSFKDGALGSFAWLPDAKTLVLTRPVTASDVVLISDFR